MRVGLEARINDTAFDPALREACAAGHKKLMQYYDIAKASNHTILATGKVYFGVSLYLQLIFLQVCHPSLRTAWFHNLGPEMHTKATAIFSHVYAEYAKTHPRSTTTAPPAPTSTDESSWLASLAAIPNAAVVQAPAERSELERWSAGDGGSGSMKFPLPWWKVRLRSSHIQKCMNSPSQRTTRRSSRSSLAWLATSLPSQVHLSP